MKRILPMICCSLVLFFGTTSIAAIVGVSGPQSEDDGVGTGHFPSEISPPDHALDDFATNRAMQGFNEVQGHVTLQDYTVDAGSPIGSTLPAGTFVDSHMIFLNTEFEPGTITENLDVVWTFAGRILAVMSDRGGTYEAASTGELGSPTTNYVTVGSNQGAPYDARGIEVSADPNSLYPDSWSIPAGEPRSLQVDMYVSQPGDWLRVITVPAPEPASLFSFGGLFVLAAMFWGRRRRNDR